MSIAFAVGAFAVSAFAPDTGRAATLAAEAWVVPPGAAPALQRAFAAEGEALRLEGARLEPREIVLKACASSGCATVTLTHTQRCGAEERLGPFCVQISGELGAGGRAALSRALGRVPPASAWVRAESSDGRARSPDAVRHPFADLAHRPEAGFDAYRRTAHPYLLAAAVLLLPFALGWGVARLLRTSLIRLLGRYRPGSRYAEAAGYRGRALAASVALGPALFAGLLPPRWVGLGFWDLLISGGLLGLGALLGVRGLAGRWRWREIALGVTSVALSAALLEGGARLLLPPPPIFPPPEAALLGLPKLYGPSDAETWAQVYPERYPAEWARRSRVRPTARLRVLHVGDSMTYGAGVAPRLRFTALLDGRSEAVAHLNAAVPGSGTDLQLLVIEQWVRRVPLDLVVLHFFVGNDLYDLDRPYPACDDQAILRYGPGGPEPRCPEPVWGSGSRRLKSPAPYPLRVATSFSVAARHLCALLWRIAHRQLAPFDEARAWRHLEVVLAAIRDRARARGVRLVVNLIPYRGALESAAAPARSSHYRSFVQLRERTAALLRRLGLETVDPWTRFGNRVSRQGSGALFLDRPAGDVHFNPAGHRLMGEFLAAELPRFLTPRARGGGDPVPRGARPPPRAH